MSRIGTEPTGLPSGGHYALLDGAILRGAQHGHPRIFASPVRALKAARIALKRDLEISTAIDGLARELRP